MYWVEDGCDERDLYILLLMLIFVMGRRDACLLACFDYAGLR
jgi:hypothetical protein